MISHAYRRCLQATLPLALTAVLAGCALPAASPASSPPDARASTSVPASPSPSPSGGVTSDAEAFASAFAERERFIEEQQLPLDGSALVAVTDAQKQFISEQRAHVESQGIEWSPSQESFYLALTADACETSILNGHEVDADRLAMHVETSPLFASVLSGLSTGDRATGEQNVASAMVFGTRFLCPADAPQWEQAFEERYG